jgi:DNA-directed RNA polymerase specialized sigma24 family protein
MVVLRLYLGNVQGRRQSDSNASFFPERFVAAFRLWVDDILAQVPKGFGAPDQLPKPFRYTRRSTHMTRAQPGTRPKFQEPTRIFYFPDGGYSLTINKLSLCSLEDFFMPSTGSVTVWITRLKAGDAIAAEQLWKSYYQRLVGLARERLRGQPRAAADEEDVALSAFHSFFQGVERNQFPQLDDRYDLWQLLVVLTARKASRMLRHENALKRGGGRPGQQALASDDEDDLCELIGREPTPDFAAQVADETRHLLDSLDANLRAVALAKMEGHTNAEIAARIEVSERTVERSLAVIRKLWGR